MGDRELLELAAKAAGYQTNHPWNELRLEMTPPVVALCIDGVSTGWNPLEHDGDALRLAVMLGMILVIGPCQIKASTTSGSLRGNFFVEDMIFNDGNEATRRAIVRAAAEIGKHNEVKA